MAAKNPARVFTAFDYDYDESLKHLLVGQSKHADSPFEMHDWSVKDPYPGDWKAKVRTNIRSSIRSSSCVGSTYTKQLALLRN